MINRVLAFETSCDDTSIAIVNKDGFVEALLSANQNKAHEPFGGVVPEIASRNHTLQILPLLDQILTQSNLTFKDIDGIAVTNRPGLIGSLIVGLVTAKTIAQNFNLPLIGVNHLEGHLLAPFLKDTEYQPEIKNFYPFIALAVSGGHTTLYQVNQFGDYKILGSTLDDAAGEAFDKFGKMLGLGFPGGIFVDQNSKGGDPHKYPFPRGLKYEETYEMSFSGLKASAQRLLEGFDKNKLPTEVSNLCSSFQEAVVDALMTKLDRAVKNTKIKNVVITGGVSANSRLRENSLAWAQKNKVQLLIPPIRYCTDNAAMIGYVGILKLNSGIRHDLTLGPHPNSLPEDFK